MTLRLAKLISDEDGKIAYGETTYAHLGSLLPRVHGFGDPHPLYGDDRPRLTRNEEYESVCIRITGGFDD